MNWSLSCVIITDYRLWELGDSPHLFWRKNTHIILFFIFESEAGLLAFKEALVQSVFLNKLTLIIISIIIQPNKLQVCMRFWGNSDSECLKELSEAMIYYWMSFFQVYKNGIESIFSKMVSNFNNHKTVYILQHISLLII